MYLNEFFGNNIKLPVKNNESGIVDDVFWFILDHDRLHKDYFIPIAHKFKQMGNNVDKDAICKMLVPLVNKGCKEYYYQNEMSGYIGKVFPKDVRQALCEKLFNHYEDIIKKKNTK